MNERREPWRETPAVQRGQTNQLHLPEPREFVYGRSLVEIQVSCESWGFLNAARDNAVLTGEETGEMVYLGGGAGCLTVAAALLHDVIGLCHSSHSWTGRLRRAPLGTPPPLIRF